jgi:thiosulfate reductase cytochrome b subunit
VVIVTHWLTLVAFVALTISGGEIVMSHPRFYWGEEGNVGTRPLFKLPVPSSRRMVPTGYNYVLLDQNGWSRYLHFEAAWLAVLTGLIYGITSIKNGHFRKDLFPAAEDRTWRAVWKVIAGYLRGAPQDPAAIHSYNVLQRTAYLGVIFVLFPLVIWTGLAMSPAFDAALPITVTSLGGRQSARTLHFLVSGLLLLFFFVHIVMVAVTGFKSRMRAMITGRVAAPRERI